MGSLGSFKTNHLETFGQFSRQQHVVFFFQTFERPRLTTSSLQIWRPEGAMDGFLLGERAKGCQG